MIKLTIALLFLPFVLAFPQDKSSSIAFWTFDETNPDYEITGKGSITPGVVGNAYKFDGFSSYIEDRSIEDIKIPRSFSIEAWISLGAYPWNWAPIVTIGKYKITGFYFGVDSRGRIGFQLSDATSVWHSCTSKLDPETKLGMELRKWYHVVGTYSPEEGMAVYVNGELEGRYNDFEFKYGVRYNELEKGFRIGMNREHLAPTDPIRDWATWPSQYSLDGNLDEIKIYTKSLSGREVKEKYNAVEPDNNAAFADRDFPQIASSGHFGANYTRLEFYPEWDNLWPVGEHLDVAVQFDDLPVKVMFWRGTRYSACWVSENNKWMADQSRETGNNWYLEDGSRDDMPTGCMEHMSDVQCRSSRVSIIENNDARVVISWRYLQMDVKFRQNDLPDNTLFGEWGNELYYIYPDGVAIRKVLPGRGGWQETILLNAPGTRPEDNVELEACTLINMDGESRSYSWEHGYPKFDLEDANIQLINFKSEYKPFLILKEGGGFLVFNGEVRPEYSHFPWWNHWPVAQIASDGRSAYAPDRAAHSSLSWGLRHGTAAMYGMTNKSYESLVDLSKSWNRPPEVELSSSAYDSEGYDFSQRAYIFKSMSTNDRLNFDLKGSANSPIVNPAFVINNWLGDEASLRIDGNIIPRGKEFRQGIEHNINGSKTLIIWIRYNSNETINITINSK